MKYLANMYDDSDILSHFAPLNELIQVIYQGSARFVILSSVDDASWTVHVGLAGDEGRWWRGMWTGKDVRNTIVRIDLPSSMHFSTTSSTYRVRKCPLFFWNPS